MTKMQRYYLLPLFFLCVLSSCSSGPATTYYRFASDLEKPTFLTSKFDQTVGVGPVILPGYLDNPAIISMGAGQQIHVSGYHAWAEPLDESMSRVIAAYVAEGVDQTIPQVFPWDSRSRPDWQIKIIVEKFDGVRGEPISLVAQWHLYSLVDNSALASGREHFSFDTETSSYTSYVDAMNQLLYQFSSSLVEQLLALEK